MVYGPISYKSLNMPSPSYNLENVTAAANFSANEDHNSTSTAIFSTNYNQNLMLIVLVLVGAILLILILVISVFVGTKLVRRCRRIQCHVCLERVDKRHWETTHRSDCQKKNLEFLKSLPEPFDIRCPNCLAYLKLMPKVKFIFHKLSILKFIFECIDVFTSCVSLPICLFSSFSCCLSV